jgi:hypothetical protein
VKTQQRIWAAALVCGFLVALAALPGSADDKDKVRLEIKVTGEGTDKPVAYASVYVKFKEKRFLRRDKKREWHVKTNPDGRAIIPAVPEGNALVQIVAEGWKTYGEFHDLKGPKQTLEIKLERPKRWY